MGDFNENITQEPSNVNITDNAEYIFIKLKDGTEKKLSVLELHAWYKNYGPKAKKCSNDYVPILSSYELDKLHYRKLNVLCMQHGLPVYGSKQAKKNRLDKHFREVHSSSGYYNDGNLTFPFKKQSRNIKKII